jgi:hypothetical protein
VTETELEDLLVTMRGDGRTRIDAIREVRLRTGCSLTEAKRTVHLSQAWADAREGVDRFHEELERELVRDAVLGALHVVYQPVAADDLALVVELTEGLEVTEASLAELAAADRAAFLAGAGRPVWICPALEYAGGRAADEFLTRSVLPMAARVVRDVLSESQELWLLNHFCGLAQSIVERRAKVPSRLGERIVDLSIHLPSDRLAEKRADRDRPDDLGVYRELAEDRFGELVGPDQDAQAHVIEALERLALPERYFGVA